MFVSSAVEALIGRDAADDRKNATQGNTHTLQMMNGPLSAANRVEISVVCTALLEQSWSTSHDRWSRVCARCTLRRDPCVLLTPDTSLKPLPTNIVVCTLATDAPCPNARTIVVWTRQCMCPVIPIACCVKSAVCSQVEKVVLFFLSRQGELASELLEARRLEQAEAGGTGNYHLEAGESSERRESLTKQLSSSSNNPHQQGGSLYGVYCNIGRQIVDLMRFLQLNGE